MDNFAKVIITLLVALAVINIIYDIIRMIPLIKRLREIKRVQSNAYVISVEGEILELSDERLNRWDTKYKLKVYYEVGYEKFYKDIVLINKQAVRVGQKITLLCDSDEPENAIVQAGYEKDMLKSYIVNLIIAIICVIIYFGGYIWEVQLELND